MFLIEVSQTWLDKRSKKRNGELFVEGAFSKLFNELETETWLPETPHSSQCVLTDFGGKLKYCSTDFLSGRITSRIEKLETLYKLTGTAENNLM